MGSDTGQKNIKGLPPFIAFSIFFFFSCGCWGLINSYLPVYFNSFGYSNTQIGFLSAVGPFITLFGLIFWGARADRARYRNNILFLLCAVLGASSQFYLLNDSYFYTFAITVIFMFCFNSLTPTCEAMFLEFAQNNGADFGKGRMLGSLGLALLPILPGIVISRMGIRSLFPVYLLLVIIIVIIIMQLPKMAGGQSAGGKRTNLLALRSDRELVGLFCFLFPLNITLGFYYSFFPVHMDNIGATSLVGVNNLAQFAMEFLFMFFLVRITKRFGFARLFILAFALTAARLLLIGSISAPVALIGVNLFGGLGYSLTMMLLTLFALRTPKELRTSAQMLTAIVAHSLPRFFGGMLGGVLSDIIGIPAVFLCAGLLDVLLLAAFVVWIYKTRALRDPVLM